MKNPWMSAWLRVMDTTLSATQAFWTELMRRRTHGTKPDGSQDAEAEMPLKAKSAPTSSAKKPPAKGETSPLESKASSDPTSLPRTDSKGPATAPKKAAAAKETATSTRSAQPKRKARPKKTAAAEKNAAAQGTVAPNKTAPPKQKAENSAAAKSKAGASAPKFQHPSNPDLTWSGRGRRPRWVTEALETGRPLDDLRVREH